MIEYPMIEWAKDLFPICRSLTGPGTRETLSYFKKLNPDFSFHTFKTGESVFDWNVPKEWEITNAYIEHESGQRFAEFSKNNLHVLGYSAPVNKTLDKEELLKHIYTQEDQADWIPYVTSYYEERWGFCMTHNQKNALPDGKYKAVVESRLFAGEMQIADAVIKGESEKELFFSSYVCHPSMANNELSGPVVLNAIMKYVKDRIPNRKYTYRFALVPETIGSIAYLSKNLNYLQANMIAGFNLSCVGDERGYSHVQSRFGNNLADIALESALIGLENVETYSFLTRGSDERQYSAPGVDLPVCGFCRSKYDTYPEYHTSADNFDVVTQNGLQGSFTVLKSIIDAFELGLFPRNNVKCEPQLGRRNLYPTISRKGGKDPVKTRMDFLAYADGTLSVFEIAKRIEKGLSLVNDEMRILSTEGIVSLNSPIYQICVHSRFEVLLLRRGSLKF